MTETLTGTNRSAGVPYEKLLDADSHPVRDILRVESCTALWGVDVDENVYPQEARLEEAFSLTKGCYVGQEVVARLEARGGNVNKALRRLRLSAPSTAGTSPSSR